MARLHHALGRDAKVLAALLDAAAINASLLGGEGFVDDTTMRANALGAPAETLKVLAGGLRALEMGRVEVRHGGKSSINPAILGIGSCGVKYIIPIDVR